MDEEKEFINYDEYNSLCKKLAAMLVDEKFNYIFGIPRGGLPISTYLSHHFDIDLITSLEHLYSLLLIRTTESEKKNKLKILIVDDIVHTGLTLSRIKRYVKPFENIEFIFVSLCLRRISPHSFLGFLRRPVFWIKRMILVRKPDYYVRVVDKWIVFPWERPNEIPNR